jgi:hypothetical protein
MKKKMVKKEASIGCSCCGCPGKSALVFKGIIAIMLGLILWFGYLDLTQVIAVVLILVGIKKLFYSSKCTC